MKGNYILFTCEHGGNRVPRRYNSLFPQKVLNSHRGYDIGALEVFHFLTKRLGAPGYYSTTSRLLVDLNRSPRHRALFSIYTKGLPGKTRQKILGETYYPYREKVEHHIEKQVGENRQVLHVSIHSFTPHFKGVTRRADLGLLYDSRRPREKKICDVWTSEIKNQNPGIHVRKNYPYRGNADGLMTALRKKWGSRRYKGVEIELNQKYFLKPSPERAAVMLALANSMEIFRLGE